MRCTCRVQTCTRPVRARGFCTTHYGRLRLHGDVQADKSLSINAEERRALRRKGLNICSRCRRILPLLKFVKHDTINVCLRCHRLRAATRYSQQQRIHKTKMHRQIKKRRIDS